MGISSEKSYAFVDRTCQRCNGDGIVFETKWATCPDCNGAGLVGSYEETPMVPRNTPSAFATRLRLTRERRKLSMFDLAKQFGWDVAHQSGIERGRVEPTDEERQKLREWVYVNEEAPDANQ